MKKITAHDLRKRLQKKEVLLIDVREVAEHKSEYINGAHLIPLAKISHKKLLSKSLPIVLHCHSGKRSKEACKKLAAEDSGLELYSLEGGITAWKKAGYKVQSSGRKVLPLDRQTQLAAGFLAFLGYVLGTFVAPDFYVISGIVGLGLIFAGVTGWCGMAKFLAKMPWNK